MKHFALGPTSCVLRLTTTGTFAPLVLQSKLLDMEELFLVLLYVLFYFLPSISSWTYPYCSKYRKFVQALPMTPLGLYFILSPLILADLNLLSPLLVCLLAQKPRSKLTFDFR